MRYEGTVYRPPSEAHSLLIQATVGCPHNRCRFCVMYKNKRFKIRRLDDIFQDLDESAAYYGPRVKTLFLPDGNTIIMKTPSLIKILERASANFPGLERITMYGSARYLALKDLEELIALRRAGLTRIHMGLESGDDETLRRIDKGTDAAGSIAAARKVRQAGIELSAYYLVGIGGRERLIPHARHSADTLNAMAPDFIRLRTYVPLENTPLYDDIQSGLFELPSAHEALEELRILISNLTGPSMIVSDHVSNYLNLTGRLPDDKPEMLSAVESALKKDPSRFLRRITHL